MIGDEARGSAWTVSELHVCGVVVTATPLPPLPVATPPPPWQMIGDETRGSAWTRALLGLPASEVHVCGDDTALGLVQHMCRATGEELVVSLQRTYLYSIYTPK